METASAYVTGSIRRETANLRAEKVVATGPPLPGLVQDGRAPNDDGTVRTDPV